MPEPSIYAGIDLIGGGTGAIDKINGSVLIDKNMFLTTKNGILYPHWLDDDSGAAEDSPHIISPDLNAGNKRWLLSGIHVKNIITKSPWFDLRAFLPSGFVIDGSVDYATEMQKWIDEAEAVNGHAFIPDGTYLFATGLTIEAGIRFTGASREGSILKKSGDIVGITITNSSHVVLESFTLDAGTNTLNGITITEWSRGLMNDIVVTNQGGHGVEFIKGNLSIFSNSMFTFNGGDGFKVNGIHDAPNTNACVYSNLDCRSNTGWGFNIENGRQSLGLLITCQQNTGGGIRINDRSNYLYLYSEANGGDDIELTSEANCKGNTVFCLDAPPVDNSAGNNLIYSHNGGAIYAAGVLNLLRFSSAGLQLANWSKIGTLTIKHDTDRQYDFLAESTDANQTVKFINNVAGFDLNVMTDGQFEAGTIGDKRGNLLLWHGSGGNQPAYIKLYSPNGTVRYLFVKDDGTVKVHNAIPTANTDGSAIGSQVSVSLLSTTTVAFNANGDTTLYTVPAGKRCVLSHAVVVAGADAGATTTLAIGQNTAETDFVPANILSNLDTQYDTVILKPIPNTTPLKNKSYATGTVIEAQVASQSGGATNTIYLFGFLY